MAKQKKDEGLPRKNLAEGSVKKGGMKKPNPTDPRPPAPRGQGARVPKPVSESVVKLVDLIGRAGLAVAARRMDEVEISVKVKPIPGKHGEVEIVIDAPPELINARRG